MRTLVHCWGEVKGGRPSGEAQVTWPSSSTPKGTPERNKDESPHQNLYTEVHSNIFITAPSGNHPNLHPRSIYTWNCVN